MSLLFRWLFALGLLITIPAVARACLWDYDTLRQERERFPSTLELITGKFPRHSREFYQWRVQDRLKKLDRDPNNFAWLDDLGVAYEKTGAHDEAIATMVAKNEIEPGVYETYSNLGTFHILAGDFEEGLPYIDKALEINPDAHFGRERYQKWLVEYVLSKQQDGKLRFPLASAEDERRFDDFIAEKQGQPLLDPEEIAAAVRGVEGMMLFANHENPLLLEALGDLLRASHDPEVDAKQLAARAYLKASYVVDDPAAKKGYVALADEALDMQEGIYLSTVRRQFAKEQELGDKWYAKLYAQELAWIREGKDADAEFDRYVANLPNDEETSGASIGWIEAALVIIAVAMLIGLVIRQWRRKNSPPTTLKSYPSRL